MQLRGENRTLLELWTHFSIWVVLKDGIFWKNSPENSRLSPCPPYLVVRNSMSLLAFSSVSVVASMSSTSWDICGRFPLLPPRLMLEEVELELSPESGTGDDWSSLRKSKPPGWEEGQGGGALGRAHNEVRRWAYRSMQLSHYFFHKTFHFGYSYD